MGLLATIQTNKTASITFTVVVVAVLALVGHQLYAFFSPTRQQQDLNRVWLIDTDTHQAFQVNLADIQKLPAYSPFSHKDTAVRAELCYWTADGKPKKDPTPVLLNSDIGDPAPTFCSDCGRLVVPRNPPAIEGKKPPPTREEYEARYQPR